METSSLRKNRPHLEAVLGPLSAADDASVRAVFDEVDGVLLPGFELRLSEVLLG